MTPRPPQPADVVPIAYAPPRGHAFDVEAKPAWMAGGRASLPFTGRHERPDFFVLLLVTQGRLRHMIDFEQVDVPRGSLMLLRPGQIHRFRLDGRWSGWLLLFRPEAVASPQHGEGDSSGEALDVSLLLQRLPATLALHADERQAFEESLARLAADARGIAPSAALAGLVRAQLQAMLWRLGACKHLQALGRQHAAQPARRLQRLRSAIDEHFLAQREVGAYARLLQCSTRTLNRLASETGQVSVKRMLDERVALEAKRMLVHTDVPVARVSDALGFDEPTNFTKFFKRCTGSTPAQFRARAGAPPQRRTRA